MILKDKKNLKDSFGLKEAKLLRQLKQICDVELNPDCYYKGHLGDS